MNFTQSMPATIAPCDTSCRAIVSEVEFQPCSPDSNSTKLAFLTGDAYARLGAPAGASTAADIAGVQTATTSNGTAIAAVSTKLGTPAGASVSVDIAANATDLGTLKTRVPSAITVTSGSVNVNLAQAVPSTGNTAHTVGDALNAARAAGFATVRISGTPGTPGATMTEYASDGVTAVRVYDMSTAGSRV